jgi:hypothetical protein
MIDILACVGLHWILRYGSILNIPRKMITKIHLFAELFKCSLCLGFWCGVLISFVSDINLLLLACSSSAVCWFADNINNLIQRLDLKVEKDIDV